jgi:hypothetical protein
MPWQAPREDEAIRKAECPCFLVPTRQLVWFSGGLCEQKGAPEHSLLLSQFAYLSS